MQRTDIRLLEQAIRSGNLAEVQAYAANLHHSGIDINTSSYATIVHCIFFAKLPSRLTRDMLQTFLDLRDANGRVLPNLNIRHINAGTPLTMAMEANNTNILQQFLDTRHNDGTLAADITAAGAHGDFWSPMTRALFMDSSNCVELLADARQADGQPILSHEDLYQALLGAHCRGVTAIENNTATRWLLNYLAEEAPNGVLPQVHYDVLNRLSPHFTTHAGYGRYYLQDEQMNQQPAPPAPIMHVQAPVPAPAPAQPTRNFVDNSQNTHNTEVVQSVEASVMRLMKRYNLDNTKKQLADIRKCILNYPDPLKSDALKTLGKIEKSTLTRSNVEITQAQVLCLMWQACLDTTAMTNEQTEPLTQEDVKSKIDSLITNLQSAQNTYGKDKAACFVGTFNKIVESLDRLHPDVVIITGRDGIKPVALMRLPYIVEEELKKLPIRQQRAIFSSWFDDFDEKPDSPTKYFFETLTVTAHRIYVEEFRTLLTENDIREVLSAIEILNQPTLHKDLEELVLKTKNLPEPAEDSLKPLYNLLHEKALHAFDVCDKSFDNEYKELLAASKCYEFAKFASVQLSQNIQELHHYGARLVKQGSSTDGQHAIAIAKALQQQVDSFVSEIIAAQAVGPNFSDLQTNINGILNSDNANRLTHYRPSIATIFKNIGIALTVIGAFCIAAKLIHSKLTTGRATFFCQKPKTSREEIVDRFQAAIQTIAAA